MAVRIVAAWYQLGQDAWADEAPNFSSWTNDEYGYLHAGSSSRQAKVVVNKFIEAENDVRQRAQRTYDNRERER